MLGFRDLCGNKEIRQVLRLSVICLCYYIFQTGRKLVARSEPPQLKKREDEAADLATREEEELAYYFTP